jgi:putative copper export protein
MKLVIVIALLAVLAALGSAGVFMLRRPPSQDASRPADKRMARALAVRVGVSVAIFLFVLLAWKLGWIAPKGLPTGR